MVTTRKLKSTSTQGTILEDKSQPLRKTNWSQFPEKLCRKNSYLLCTEDAQTSTNHGIECINQLVSSHICIWVH